MSTLRRLTLGALVAAQIGLASWPAAAQVTLFADNDARRFIKALQTDLAALETALKDRIAVVEASSRAAVASASAESRSRSVTVADEARERLAAAEANVKLGMDRLFATLTQKLEENSGRLRIELAQQRAELVGAQGVLKDNQVMLQGDMQTQSRQQDEFNRKAAVRLEDLQAEIGALTAGRVEVSRALDQLREDAQKWLAPLQTGQDQLARDLTVTQRLMRDQASVSADLLRKAEEAQRKLDDRVRDLDEALRQGETQWRKALDERAAGDEVRAQRFTDALREADQRVQQLEERLRKAMQDAARGADERAGRLEQALRQADARLTEADGRMSQAEARMSQAETRMSQADARLTDVDTRLVEADKRLAQADGRLVDAEARFVQADARMAEAEAKLAQAEERSREADERLARIDEALRKVDERHAQSDAKSARVDERVVRIESRWRQVDEQARQRGVEVDISPLAQRVGRVEDRLRKIEPLNVVLDGVEFPAHADEKRLYDEAIGLVGKGEFEQAAAALTQFLRRYPASGYTAWVRFWQGHAWAGQREHRNAISSFRALVSESPNHPKAAEAMLALATSQLENKDRVAARKSLEDLLRLYPDSDASKVGRQRLISMK